MRRWGGLGAVGHLVGGEEAMLFSKQLDVGDADKHAVACAVARNRVFALRDDIVQPSA